MKSISTTLIILALFSAGCSDSTPLTNDLIGRWQLTESLADPGDGSGTWQKASGNNFLVFKSDGTLIDSSDPEVSNFRIIKKDSAIQIVRNNTEYPQRYKISGFELLMTPQCIEGCGSKYKKVSELANL